MTLLEIGLTDYQRILFGEDLNVGILLEVVLRTVFVYMLLMVSMRMMGKRMSSQLSRLELISLVSMAAAIGVPVLAPEQGLLPAVIIAAIVVGSQWIITIYNYKNERFEKLIQGDVSILVKDGIFKLDAMRRSLITHERIRAQLRSENLIHSGEVKLLFLEANGSFSVVKSEDPKPGISLIPEFDTEFEEKMSKKTNARICKNCGVLQENATDFKCSNCDHSKWVYAIQRKDGID